MTSDVLVSKHGLAMLKAEGAEYRFDDKDTSPAKTVNSRWIELRYEEGKYSDERTLEKLADEICWFVADDEMYDFLAALANKLYKDEGI